MSRGSQRAPAATGQCESADWGCGKWGVPLTFVRLGRRAWKGAEGPLPRHGISILPRPLLRGPAATIFFCCGPKISRPGDLPRPWASIWQGKEVDEARRVQTAKRATTPVLLPKKPGLLGSHCPPKSTVWCWPTLGGTVQGQSLHSRPQQAVPALFAREGGLLLLLFLLLAV